MVEKDDATIASGCARRRFTVLVSICKFLQTNFPVTVYYVAAWILARALTHAGTETQARR